MEDLRKKLSRLKRLSFLRDRKSKRVEEIRDILFRGVIKPNTFLFTSKEEYKVLLRKHTITLERIDIKISNSIKELQK